MVSLQMWSEILEYLNITENTDCRFFFVFGFLQKLQKGMQLRNKKESACCQGYISSVQEAFKCEKETLLVEGIKRCCEWKENYRIRNDMIV